MILFCYLTYETYHGVGRDYLCELLSKRHVINPLESNGIMLLDEPKIKIRTYMTRDRCHVLSKIHSNNNKRTTLASFISIVKKIVKICLYCNTMKYIYSYLISTNYDLHFKLLNLTRYLDL